MRSEKEPCMKKSPAKRVLHALKIALYNGQKIPVWYDLQNSPVYWSKEPCMPYKVALYTGQKVPAIYLSI